MAITFVANTSGATSAGTNVTPTVFTTPIVGGAASNSCALYFAGWKPFSVAAPSATSSGASGVHNLLGSVASGSVADGVSTGSVKSAAYLWDSTGSSVVAPPSQTLTVTGSSVLTQQTLDFSSIFSGQSYPLYSTNYLGLADTDETLTAVNATGTATAGLIRTGDWLAFHVALKDDAIVHTSQALTVAGCTLGAVTWLTELTTTSGNDAAHYVGYCQVTAGSSTATANGVAYTATSNTSGASSCAVSLVVLREQNIATITKASPSAFTLAWQNPNALTATLERSPSFSSPSWTTIYTGTGTSYTDTGLSASIKYYYRLTISGETGSVTGGVLLPFTEDFSSTGTAIRPWENWLDQALTPSTASLATMMQIQSGQGYMAGDGAGSGAGVRALLTPGMNDRTDQGVTFKYTHSSNATTAAALRVTLRGSGDWSHGGSTLPRNGLVLRIDPALVNLGQMVDNVATSPLTEAIQSGSKATTAPGTTYRARCEVIGQTLRYRIWADGSTEPTTWTTSWNNLYSKGNLQVAYTTNGDFASSVLLDDITYYDISTGNITLVGTGILNGSATAGTTAVVPVATGTANGDLLVMSVQSQSATVPTLPTGWTSLKTASGTNVSTLVCYRFASSEPASYTVTTASSRSSAAMLAFRGVDPTTPFDVTTPAAGAGTTAQSFPAITPVTDNAWILAIGAFSQASTTTPAVTSNNLTALDANCFSQGLTTTIDAMAEIGHYVWNTGVGAFTPTMVITGTTTTTQSFSIALRPATVAVGSATLSLSAVANNNSLAGTAALSLSASGTPSFAGTASALALSGAATPSFAGTASALSLSASGSPSFSGTSSLSLSGSAIPSFSGSSSLSLSASNSQVQAPVISASAALSLSGSATPSFSGTSALSLSASNTQVQARVVSASAALTLSGSATPSFSGSSTLALSGAGIAQAPGSGSASLALSGSADPQAVAASVSSLTLAASGAAQAPNSGTATLTLSGSATAIAVYSDDFNRADGDLGSNWVGVNVTAASRLQIASNVVAASNASAVSRWAAPVGSGTQFSQAKYLGTPQSFVAVAIPGFALGAGLSNIGSFFVWKKLTGTTGIALQQHDAGTTTYTTFTGTTVADPAVGDILRVEWDGTTLTGYINGVLKASVVPSFGYPGQNYVGIGTTSNTSSGSSLLDDWSGGPYLATTTVSGSASLTLSASGAAQGVGSGTASLSLTATGAGRAVAAGSATLTLSGAATPQTVASSTATLTLNASGTPQAPTVSTATLTLTGSGTTQSVASGTATLTLFASGTAGDALNFLTPAQSEFESITHGWSNTAGGCSQDNLVAHNGSNSLRIDWSGGTADATTTVTVLTVGITYRFTAWVRSQIRGTVSPDVAAVFGTAVGSTVTVTDTWQQITVDFVATATSHAVGVRGFSPSLSDQTFLDSASVVSLGALVTGTASLTLSGSGTAQAAGSGTAALSLSASGVAAVVGAGSASLSLTASGAAKAVASGAASLALSASGAAQAPDSGTATLSLSASGTAQAQAVGTASLALTGTVASAATDSGSSSLTLTASSGVSGNASGSASLSLSGSGSGSGAPSGSASLSLTATGTPQAAIDGTGTLVMFGAATGTTAATGSLALSGSGAGQAPDSSTASLTLSGTAVASFAGTATVTLSATGSASITFSDDFNRADGDLGSNWVGVNVTAASRLQIASNVAAAANSTTVSRWATAVGSGTQFSQAKYLGTPQSFVAVAIPGFAVGVGLGAIASFYIWKKLPATGGIALQQKDALAASYTTFAGTTVPDPAVGDILRVEWDGTTLTGYINGVAKASVVPGSPLTGQNYVGIGTTNASSSGQALFDDWSGGPYQDSTAVSGSASLSLSGVATGSTAATGSLALSGSGGGQAANSSTASLALAASGATQALDSGSGSLTLTGTVTPSFAGTATVALSASASTLVFANFTDDFNRADSALSADGTWVTTTSGPMSIVSNQVVGGSAISAARWAVAVAATPAIQRSRVQWLGGGQAGPAVAMPAFVQGVGQGSAGSWYLLAPVTGNNTLVLKQKDSGANSATTLTTVSKTLAVGDYLSLQYDGTTLTAYVNGVQVITYTPASPLSISAQPYVGLANNLSTNGGLAILDDWSGGPYQGSTAVSGSASLSLSASGAAKAPASGTGALSITASGTGQASATGTAALTLSGAATGQARASGTATLSLSGTASGQAPATGSASVTLGASAFNQINASGAASVGITAAATSATQGAGTATLGLSGAATGAARASGSASVSLSAAGLSQARAAGTASVSLTASGTARGTATGSASISLSATGAGRAPQTGSAALGLSGASGASGQTGGLGTLSLVSTATLAAQANAEALLALHAVGGPPGGEAAGSASLTFVALGTAHELHLGPALIYYDGATVTPMHLIYFDGTTVRPANLATFT